MEEQETELTLKHNALLESKSAFKKYLDFGISFLANAAGYYEQASPATKKRIIGSIFPEKLTFDGSHYRTTKINELFAN